MYLLDRRNIASYKIQAIRTSDVNYYNVGSNGTWHKFKLKER